MTRWTDALSLSDSSGCSILGFLRGIGVKIESWGLFLKGGSDSFLHYYCHDKKMYDIVVPATIPLHKKEFEELYLYLIRETMASALLR